MLKVDMIKIGLKTPDLHKRIQVALANIPVWDSDIQHSYLGKPDISRKRFKPVANILNDISKWRNAVGEKIDLLVFPEVSIPYAWESMLVAWARKHWIGIVCGLEHRVSGGIAYNEVLAALPYRAANHHWGCIPVRRVKRLYSPEETFLLTNERLIVPPSKDNYHLIQWRGASFAVYNCYELASIEDRCLFKGKVDFVVVTEFNRDVHYFSNIVESAARDLHCYVIQVNGKVDPSVKTILS